MASEFPGNSQHTPPAKKAQAKEERKEKIEAVVTGKVIQRKKPLGRRFVETFTGDGGQGVFNYVVMDVVVPQVKDLISDMVREGVDRTLWGESRARGPRRTGGGILGSAVGHVAYNQYSSGGLARRDEPRSSVASRTTRDIPRFDELIVGSRVEADYVLEGLNNLIARYEMATVAELYSLVNLTGDFTHEKYGWFDVSDAGYRRVKDGYLLLLPRPEPID